MAPRVSPITSMAYIPEDLIPLILESHDHWWYQDLSRLALVSTTWLGPVRRRLYALPRLFTYRACAFLVRSLSGNSSLKAFIHGIELYPHSAYASGHHAYTDDISFDSSNIHDLLDLDLRSLTLGGDLAVSASRFLHLISNPQNMRTLHIDGSLDACCLARRPSLEWDDTLACKFSCLQQLKLAVVDLDILYPTPPCAPQLTDLRLFNVTLLSGHLFHLLSHSASPGRLSITSGWPSEFDEQVKSVISSCAVESLEYEVQNEDPSPTTSIIIEDDLGSLPLLRTLQLTGVHVDVDCLALIRRLCCNLEALSVAGRQCVRIVPDEWVAFLNASPGSLRQLTLSPTTYGPPLKRWTAEEKKGVADAAAERRIKLEWM